MRVKIRYLSDTTNKTAETILEMMAYAIEGRPSGVRNTTSGQGKLREITYSIPEGRDTDSISTVFAEVAREVLEGFDLTVVGIKKDNKCQKQPNEFPTEIITST